MTRRVTTKAKEAPPDEVKLAPMDIIIIIIITIKFILIWHK